VERIPEMIRTSVEYRLPQDQAIAAIEQFNSSLTLVAADALLSRQFTSPQASPDPDTLAMGVTLLDAVWATQLFREAGASDSIVRSLAQNSIFLVSQLESLGTTPPEEDPHAVDRVARAVLPVILNHSEGFRENYSFATKFFHRITRIHFPIADGRARKSINARQRTHDVSARVRIHAAAMAGLAYVDEYSRWILFYADLIRGLSKEARDALQQADYHSLPRGYRIENSILRMLDKVFYIRGGGTGVGRIVARDAKP
jgi:hypothetical protein